MASSKLGGVGAIRVPIENAILDGQQTGGDVVAGLGLRQWQLGQRELGRAVAPVMLCLVTGSISLAGCGHIARLAAPTIPIEMAIETADGMKEVYIRGRVINQFALLGQGAYEVEDDSGRLWVTTRSGLPEMNADIVVKGIATTGVRIGTRSFGVTLSELERL